MKILVASDHGGFSLKEAVVAHLKGQGHDVQDLGCQNAQSVDYPDYAEKVAGPVSQTPQLRGILICGSGVGMAIAANKFKGVRAAVINDPAAAQLAREHNDLNVLCLGGRVVEATLAFEIIEKFLSTPFEGGRHTNRLAKITKLEGSHLE